MKKDCGCVFSYTVSSITYAYYEGSRDSDKLTAEVYAHIRDNIESLVDSHINADKGYAGKLHSTLESGHDIIVTIVSINMIKDDNVPSLNVVMNVYVSA